MPKDEITRLRSELDEQTPGSAEWADVAVALSHELVMDDRNLDEAIDLSLAIVAAFPHGVEREAAVLNLGTDLSRRHLLGGALKDLRSSLHYGEESLNGASPELKQAAAANLGSRLLTAYEEGIKEGNLDRAVKLLEEARRLSTLDTEDYVAATSNLATALSLRFERDGASEDLDRSLGFETEALLLSVSDQEIMAGHRANRANILHSMWEATGLDAHLRAAREDALVAAKEGTPRPDALARRLLTLAQIEATLSDLDDDTALIETAIARAKKAASLVADDYSAHAHHLTSLAAILYLQHLRGAPNALDESLAASTEAFRKSNKGSTNWAMATNEMVGSLTEKFQVDGNSADLARAIAIGRDGVSVITERSARGAVLTNTAIALRFLHDTTDPDETVLLDEAIELVEEAIQLSGTSSPHQVPCLHTASMLYASRSALSPREEAERLTKLAIKHARLALGHVSAIQADQHVYMTQLASVLAEGSAADLDEAIELFTAAFQLVDAGAPSEAQILFGLGCRYEQRSEIQDSDDDLQNAISCFDHILTLDRPTIAVFAAQKLGFIAIRLEMWDKVEEAFALGIAEASRNTDHRIELYDKERARFDIQGAGALAALGAFRSGGSVRVVDHLEDVASTLLKSVDIGVSIDSVSLPVLYVADSVIGGIAALVDDSGIQVVELPRLTTDAVESEILALRSAFRPMVGDEFDHWNNAVEDLLSFTWSSVSVELCELLTRHTSATLVPIGNVSELPIEVARSGSDSLLGKVLLSRLPTTKIGSVASRRATAPLVIADPGHSRRRIQNVLAEAEAIKRVWPNAEMWISGESESQGARSRNLRSSGAATGTGKSPDPQLLRLVKSCDLLHVACHYDIDRSDPRNSTLQITEGVRVAELFDALDHRPHVVLSACDGGVAGDRLPDEAVSASSALLEAGASGITAALWPLDDETTPTFMTEFHRHLSQGLTPTEALSTTQLAFSNEPPMVWAAYVHVGSTA